VSCQVHRLAQALCERGHALTCFSFSPRPSDAKYNHQQLSASRATRFRAKFAAGRAFAHVNTTDFDILHYHGDDYLCRGSTRRVRTFYGSALLEAMHSHSAGRFAYQSLFYFFELISQTKKGTLAGISNITKSCLPFVKTVIPCGVPLTQFFPAGKKTVNPSILFLGDIHSRKRGYLMLDVFFKTILPQVPECTLTIIGPEQCSGKNVIYAGNVDNGKLIEYYRSSWIYCMASSYEGFGVPAIEAMACNTAVIARNNPGIADIIAHKKTGMLATDRSFGEMIVAVLTDALLREALCKNALKSVSEKFDIAKVAQQYESLYYAALQLKEPL
jgi:glycosyltransferase involved in cell wall biosynthesis